MIINQLIIYLTRQAMIFVLILKFIPQLIVLKVKEVLPNSDRTLAIEVNGNYISLPGELFKDLNESGIIAKIE